MAMPRLSPQRPAWRTVPAARRASARALPELLQCGKAARDLPIIERGEPCRVPPIERAHRQRDHFTAPRVDGEDRLPRVVRRGGDVQEAKLNELGHDLRDVGLLEEQGGAQVLLEQRSPLVDLLEDDELLLVQAVSLEQPRGLALQVGSEEQQVLHHGEALPRERAWQAGGGRGLPPRSRPCATFRRIHARESATCDGFHGNYLC